MVLYALFDGKMMFGADELTRAQAKGIGSTGSQFICCACNGNLTFYNKTIDKKTGLETRHAHFKHKPAVKDCLLSKDEHHDKELFEEQLTNSFIASWRKEYHFITSDNKLINSKNMFNFKKGPLFIRIVNNITTSTPFDFTNKVYILNGRMRINTIYWINESSVLILFHCKSEITQIVSGNGNGVAIIDTGSDLLFQIQSGTPPDYYKLRNYPGQIEHCYLATPISYMNVVKLYCPDDYTPDTDRLAYDRSRDGIVEDEREMNKERERKENAKKMIEERMKLEKERRALSEQRVLTERIRLGEEQDRLRLIQENKTPISNMESTESQEVLLARWKSTLTPKELAVHSLAAERMGDRYSPERCNAFLSWLKKQQTAKTAV